MLNKIMARAAEDLASRYESITLDEIQDVWDLQFRDDFAGDFIADKLTGFDSKNTCLLCKAAKEIAFGTSKPQEKVQGRALHRMCKECIYQEYNGCLTGNYKKSYYDIVFADCPEALLQAFRNRAKIIRKRILELSEE